MDTKEENSDIKEDQGLLWATPLCDCLPVLVYKEVILNLMVWGPLQETDFLMFAWSCLPEREQIQKVKKKLCVVGCCCVSPLFFFLGGGGCKKSTIEGP